MSIAALITQGIGPGGSVPYLLTGGLDIGAAVAAATPAVDVAGPGRRSHQPYRPGERRQRGLEWTKRKKIEELVEEAYQALYGELQEAVNEPGTIREAVAPFVQAASDTPIPPPQAIDFVALSADLMRAEFLLQQYEAALKEKALRDDDEEVMELMLLS